MFLKQIQNMNLQAECDLSHPCKAMTIQVGFSHKENENDETEFCINAWDKKELAELFEIFCKENHFEAVSINSLSIVRVASSLDELTKMEELEEKSPDSVLRKEMIIKWRDIYFEESETMITLLRNNEANELTKDEKEYLLEWSGDDEYAYVSDNGEIVLIDDED